MTGYEDYVRERFNSGAEVQYADRRLTLSALLAEEGLKSVDVLKIDTDGADYEALKSLEPTFETVRPLWIKIEVSISPSGEQPDGAFADVDTFLRSKRYTLIDLESWRYSRAALPAPFVYELPAQTRTGPVAWGDAIYVDDPLATSGELGRWLRSKNGLARAVRLAALYDIYGFADCAAELLFELRRHPKSRDRADWTAMLDLLVPPNPYGETTYDGFIEAFKADPQALYPKAEALDLDLALENARLSSELAVARRMVERRKRRVLLLSTRTVAAQAETIRLQAKLGSSEDQRQVLLERLDSAVAEARRLQAELEQAYVARQKADTDWAAKIERAQAEAALELKSSFERWGAEADAALQRAEAKWKAEAAEHLRQCEETWRAESANALLQAQQAWQAEEASRSAKAEATWRAELENLNAREQRRAMQAAQREKAIIDRFESERSSAEERHRNERLSLGDQHVRDLAALSAEHGAALRRAEEAAERERALWSQERLELESQIRGLNERLLEQTRKAAEREAAILARAREAWSLNSQDRGDVFDVLAAARKRTQEMLREQQSMALNIAQLEEARSTLRELLAHSGRFTLRRWLGGDKDPLQLLP